MTIPPAPAGPDPRAALRAELAGRPAPSLRPANLVSAEPLRPLPGALLAKLEVRRREGFDPVGADHPRREPWLQLVFLGFGLGAIALVVLLVALITGPAVFEAVTGGVLAVSVVGALLARAWMQSDPLRIRRDERRAFTSAGHWESRQPWTGALAAGPERALLGVAVETAGQVAGSPAWTSGYLDGHRLVLDLGAELDAVDAQAFQVAQARARGGAAADVEAGMDACLDRVLALRGYASGLQALTNRIASADAELGTGAAPAIGQLRGGTDQARYAVQGIGQLTSELGVISSSIDATVAQVRSQRG